jgi:peptide/nickel transport system permease protein
MSLLRYSLRRLLLLVPTLFGVTVVAFVLLRVLPGDPIATILGQTAGEEEIAAARARFGLDKPIIVQFWDYLTNLVSGDLGTSIQSGRPVREEILDRIGPTLELVILGVGIAVVCALVFGVWSAMRVNRPIDHGIRITSLVGNSVPDFWLGLLLILVFYASLGWAPAPSGRVDGDVGLEQITGSGIVDSIITGNVAALRSVLAHLALPVITLVIAVTAPLLRSVRASALEVRGSDAYAVAAAHGMPPRRLITAYLLRPTLVRLPALAALVLGFTLGSVVLVEQVYSWQGLGQWTLRGVLYRDYPVVQAAIVVMALIYMLAFAVADIVHAVLDPRIRLT